VRAAAVAALAAVALPAVAGGNLKDMPVFASENGVLDILMIAKGEPATLLQPLVPKAAMVYEICPRPDDGSEECPSKYDTPNLYGGTRLQLEAGDLLKIHLVNRLPPIFDSSHSTETGLSWLALSPTNLHTHGMIVSPRYPTKQNPTYGDNVFVLTLNPANGLPAQGSEFHSDVRLGWTDYEIRIPPHHPSGLYWFHPHVHGVSSNQVTSGLSGVITVGKLSDYVCKGAADKCRTFVDDLPVRTMMLKDTQVMPDGSIWSETDPAFCEQHEKQKDPPKGLCPGVDGYAGGYTYETLNGQIYPNINVSSKHGEVWRLTNASSNQIFDLRLLDSTGNKEGMVVQVLQIDGVAVSPRKDETAEELLAAGGAKFDPVPCGTKNDAGTKEGRSLCVRRMMMMPASRVTVWVAYRDADGNLAAPPPGGVTADFRTTGHATGEIGGAWTAMSLAKVTFQGTGPDRGDPQALTVADDAHRLASMSDIAEDMRSYNVSIHSDQACTPLPKGHKRRIYLGNAGETLNFGIGYEEIDENGDVVPGSLQDITPFNPDKPQICVPLGPGNSPVHERWQILNIADEDHSFHIHQTRFYVVARDKINGEVVPGVNDPGVLHDSIPLKHGSGDCESIGAYHAGLCTSVIEEIEIPFAVAGDFVYHCHILEHEDGGMMARIRVRPNPDK
jgi:FtsP/CotA-like multicopper oxidase with cupredoxin domain